MIALVKDVPDVHGDKLFGIRSFSVRAGGARVLQFAIGLLRANFLGAAAALAFSVVGAATRLAALRRGTLAFSALMCSWLIGRRASGVKASEPTAVYQLYMALWAAFYASYMLLPFAR